MITPSNEVLEVLRDAEISLPEFQRMVRSAAIVTHGLGNRRFHNWVFRIEEGHCFSMSKWVKEIVRPSTQDLIAYEECEECEGVGCNHCASLGQVRVIYQRQRSVSNEKAVRHR